MLGKRREKLSAPVHGLRPGYTNWGTFSPLFIYLSCVLSYVKSNSNFTFLHFYMPVPLVRESTNFDFHNSIFKEWFTLICHEIKGLASAGRMLLFFLFLFFNWKIHKVVLVSFFLALSLWLRFHASRGKISAYEEDILNSCTVFLPSNVPLFALLYSLKELHICEISPYFFFFP